MPRPHCYLSDATLADLGALADLERRCFTHPWTREQIAEPLRHQAGGRVLALRSPLVLPDGLLAYCIHRLVLDDLDVSNLAVHPDWRRLGLGRLLLREVLKVAAGKGARSAYLEVRQSNWAALELYRASGFDIVGTRRGYYDSPREDAFLLRRTLGPEAPARAVLGDS
jgi:ribosomal-protein-alanine N-acetyltransferase